MRCSASGMFASDNVNSCTCVIRKSIYSLTTRIFKSTNQKGNCKEHCVGRRVLYVGSP